tara:strand:+ start:15900 stop:16145 length:246 start_codon:yes stop_codon:yes gene_type:complete
MMEYMSFILIILSTLCHFWLNLKIYKANEFIGWSKSVDDIDNVISERVFIKKMELDTLFEFLRLSQMVLVISCLVFFIQTI